MDMYELMGKLFSGSSNSPLFVSRASLPCHPKLLKVSGNLIQNVKSMSYFTVNVRTKFDSIFN